MFVSHPCPICGCTGYEKRLRFRWLHILLCLVSGGAWLLLLLLDWLFEFFWNQNLFWKENVCMRCKTANRERRHA